MALPNVTFIRKELARLIGQYNLISDCLSGEETIKNKKTKYLPMPNANLAKDPSCKDDVLSRYDQYLLRAVFYNVTRRTLNGLVGQVFTIDPEIKLPPLLQILEDDANGAGIGLVNLSKKSLEYVIAYSRGGLFVDYPFAPEGATIADLQAGNIRPTIKLYAPEQITNWRTVTVGAKVLLSLVVLQQSYIYGDDGFELKNACEYVVLKLDGNLNYNIEYWREENPTEWDGVKDVKNKNFKFHQSFVPKDATGTPFKQIPFFPMGSENNDINPDDPNMFDLASINIAHYRNSADYEEACFIVGQPTPVVTGIDEAWYKNVLMGRINFGSRGGVPLPTGGDLKLVQATENTMLKESMEAKERQMVALGAKLVEQKQVQRTAFETKVESVSESSTLSSSAKNVSAAFEAALKFACLYTGEDPESVEFDLNSDLDISSSSTEERNAIVTRWTQGAISWDEMRTGLRKSGVELGVDEDAKTAIEAATAADNANAIALAQATKPQSPVAK